MTIARSFAAIGRIAKVQDMYSLNSEYGAAVCEKTFWRYDGPHNIVGVSMSDVLHLSRMLSSIHSR